MKKKKSAVSLLLSLSLICTMIIPGTVAIADNDNGESGMVISKTATDNGDGTYTIELEAYATGETIITEITEDVPTDIVLVLDQSGSMAERIGTVSFSAYSNNQSRNSLHYDRRHNGGGANLWHQLADGSYAAVSVVRQDVVSYSPFANNTQNSAYYENRNNLYEKVGDEYKQVTLSRTGTNWSGYTYTYAFSDNTTVTSTGRNSVPALGSHAPLYEATVDNTQSVYTYTYTDSEGVIHTIGTSTGANTVFGTTLYQRSINENSGETKLNALRTAVTAFANSVKDKAAGTDGDSTTTEDNINHRIAVVGFASRSGYGNNTELLSISGSNSGSVGVAYNNISNQNLIDVLQDMDTTAGQTMVTNAVNALAAEGATQVDLGINMAQRILNANPVPAGELRNRVVVVFTDGAPTSFNGFEKDVANDAISTANSIKDTGTTVYSVGVFAGANASSAGIEPAGYLDQDNNSLPAASNWFMQNLSSNNGTPQIPSYYLSASDAGTLNSIFQQISDQIETGGSSTTLSEETVIKDIVAPAFTLPEGVTADDIIMETYACTGKDTNDNYTWSKNAGAMGATAIIGSTNTNNEITTDNQVSVTGFDFAENYVGTVTENGVVTYRGHKLVIKLTVTPRPGFLGGNGVSTNTNAGVYENADATNPVLTFEQPTVDVPIPEITINTPSGAKNIFLLQTIPSADIHEGVSVQIGNQSLDLAPDAVNWGLEPWQNEYLDISVTYEDEEGNPIPQAGLQNITGDTNYSVTVAVEPKAEGTVPGDGVTQTGSVTVNVFTPELTFQDDSVYYGDDVPSDTEYAATMTSTKWKHGTTYSTDPEVTMIGTAPTLSLTYTPEAGKVAGGKVNSKQDVEVDVTVVLDEADVTEHTAFLHAACDPACDWNETALDGSPAFLLHVSTCTLEIQKTGGASDESYVFDIYKNGVKYSEVTIWGNGSEMLYELPVGNYTIKENSGWSWRYSANNGSTAALTANSPSGTITCNNTKTNDYWLNGFSQVVRNIFGVND